MRSLVRSLAAFSFVSLLISLFVLLFLLPTHRSFAAGLTQHACASPTPPTVTGPLYQPAATQGVVAINEVLLTPHSNWNCSELNTYTATNDTWLEIYNPQNQPLDLYAVHASIDSGPNTNSFYLPFGSAIAAHGFLVVFPRTDANFLMTETMTWRLLIAGTPVDIVKLPDLGEDQSYARIPDGGSTWEITNTPTIDASNTVVIATPTKTSRGSGGTGSSPGGSGKGGAGEAGGTGGTGGAGTGQGGQSSTDAGGGQQGSNGQSSNDGQQPSWSKLHTPTTATGAGSAGSSSSTSTSFAPLPSSPTMDVPRKIVLTVLVIALALALLWCWRVFRRPIH